MEWLTESVQTLLNWLSTDQYGFWEELAAYVMVKATIWKMEFMLWSMQFSWGVAQAVLDQLNISGHLETAWSSLDSYVLGWLTYLKVPEGINMVLSGFVGRFVMRFMGWS